MKRKTDALVLTLMSLALCAPSAAASSFRSLAKKLSHAAAEAGVRRLAVLPMTALNGSDEAEGRRIADELATDISLRGELTVVERSMLGRVMEEHSLGQTGALEKESLSRLGALQQAEAVAAGTFVTLGNTVEVNVRVILIETGAVVAARSVRMKRDWFPALQGVIPEPAPISADEAVADVYEYQTGRVYRPARERRRRAPALVMAPPLAPWTEARSGARDVRDALRDECAGAAQRVDAMQEDILELKARYWAVQAVKPGFSAKTLRDGPGGVISSPELRERFFEMMKEEAERGVRPLSMTEVKRFIETDMKSFVLHAHCSSPGGGNRAANVPEGGDILARR